MPELCLIYWWYCSITLTLQTHKQVRKYRIFNCTDLYSNAQYYILKLPLYIPVDTMYIKFYNALGQVDPLAGRGQSPVPKLGRGQGRHLTLPLYSHMLSLTHTHKHAITYAHSHKCTSSVVWCTWPLFHLVMVTYKATPASNLSVTLSLP